MTLYMFISYAVLCCYFGWWLGGNESAWGMLGFVVAGFVALEVGYFAKLVLGQE